MDNKELGIIAKKLVEQHAQAELKNGFEKKAVHRYDDEQGNLLYFRIRLKHPDGRKWIRPFYFDYQIENWVMREPDFPNGKPLYRLPLLAKKPTSEIWIVEGESNVDVLVKLGIVATTSGGANSAESANWDIFQGRSVIIWRDFDEEGLNYAIVLTAILTKLSCTIRYVDVDALGLALKGDAVDWLTAHPTTTAADILSLPTLNQIDIPDSDHQLSPGDDIAVTIDKLARLSKFDYFNQRLDSARTLGIGLTQLDALVKERQAEIAATETQEMFQTIIPWPEPVNGQWLLNEIEQLINSIMVLPSEHEAKAIALFVLHTYFIEAVDCTPILLICSPEKRCGKTTLLTILQKLVNKPLPASNISPAAIYRSIDKWSPTLIIDEADSFMRDNEEIRGVINSGHTRSHGFVIRCVGTSHEPKPFNTFCPKIIAGIGHQADTIEDRAIVIQLKRKLTSDNNKKIRDVGHAKFEELVRKATRFAQDFIESMQDIKPSIPNGLNDRAADNWATLLAIATIAGNEWLDSASLAATGLSESSESTVSVEIELLQDIKTIFEEANTQCLQSSELVEKLCEDLDSPWATYNRGKPITARQIAKKLKGFGIKSKDRRFGYKTLKGYSIEDFRDTFERYLSSILPDNEPVSATPQQGNQDAVYKEFHMRNNADKLREVNPIKPKPSVDCSVVADKIENEEKQSMVETRRIVL